MAGWQVRRRRLVCGAWATAVWGAVALVGSGCGGGEPAAAADGAAGASAPFAGPCDAELRWADGKVAAGFIAWSYDAAGRKISEKRHDLTAATGFETWTYAWTWTGDGQLGRETFVTSAKGEDDHDWTWTYGADGKPSTRVGHSSSYDGESCTFEHANAASGKADFHLVCATTWETKDKRGNPKTHEGQFAEHHTFFEGLPGAAYGVEGAVRREVVVHDNGKGGKPSKEVSWVWGAAGQLLAVETDDALQGFPTHSLRYAYDAAGHKASETLDDSGDGVADRVTTWSYDGVGNVVRADFDVGADGSIDHAWHYGYGCW